jgi:hypothetical protein
MSRDLKNSLAIQTLDFRLQTFFVTLWRFEKPPQKSLPSSLFQREESFSRIRWKIPLFPPLEKGSGEKISLTRRPGVVALFHELGADIYPATGSLFYANISAVPKPDKGAPS